MEDDDINKRGKERVMKGDEVMIVVEEIDRENYF